MPALIPLITEGLALLGITEAAGVAFTGLKKLLMATAEKKMASGMAADLAAKEALAVHAAEITAATAKTAGKTASLGSKLMNGSHILGAAVVTPLFAYDMIKSRFEQDPGFGQRVANGEEAAINELSQMMQNASQGGRQNVQDQYNTIKANERVDTVKSYLGANAPGAQKGVLGNRNDLQHLIQGHQDMLGQVGRQEPMSMLEAYARQGIVPPQGYR